MATFPSKQVKTATFIAGNHDDGSIICARVHVLMYITK